VKPPPDDAPPPESDPWADDPFAPAEPGAAEPAAGPRGPAALLDPELRRQIEDEILFQQTRAALAAGPPPPAVSPRLGWVLLVVSLGLFVLSFWSEGVRWLGAAVPVVFLHELGHYLGMRAFGYRNVRMFFIPFFGAAVTGRHESAPAWQQAVTLLLGPLPGIAAGLAVYAAVRPEQGTWLFDFCLLLVGLNAFNLLPVVPLDGGRLFEVLFLARRPWPGTVYRLAAVAALAAGAYLIGGAAGAAVGVMAALVLLATPVAHLLARSRRALRRAFPDLPERADRLSDEQLRQVFAIVRRVRPFEFDPARLAAVVREVHGQAASRPAGVLVSTLLMTAFVAGVAATAGYLALVVTTERGRADALADRFFAATAATPPDVRAMRECLAVWQAARPAVQQAAFQRVTDDPRGDTLPAHFLRVQLVQSCDGLRSLAGEAPAAGR
jgi:Zn-dependent protease